MEFLHLFSFCYKHFPSWFSHTLFLVACFGLFWVFFLFFLKADRTVLSFLQGNITPQEVKRSQLGFNCVWGSGSCWRCVGRGRRGSLQHIEAVWDISWRGLLTNVLSNVMKAQTTPNNDVLTRGQYKGIVVSGAAQGGSTVREVPWAGDGAKPGLEIVCSVVHWRIAAAFSS